MCNVLQRWRCHESWAWTAKPMLHSAVWWNSHKNSGVSMVNCLHGGASGKKYKQIQIQIKYKWKLKYKYNQARMWRSQPKGWPCEEELRSWGKMRESWWGGGRGGGRGGVPTARPARGTARAFGKIPRCGDHSSPCLHMLPSAGNFDKIAKCIFIKRRWHVLFKNYRSCTQRQGFGAWCWRGWDHTF